MDGHDLPEDVWRSVLAFCDVATVLSLGAINKYLREIALSKQVWLAIVRELAWRLFIDVDSKEEAVLAMETTQQLVSRVKRLVRGPHSWANGVKPVIRGPHSWANGVKPVVQRTQLIDAPLPRPTTTRSQLTIARGGHYFVIRDHFGLRIHRCVDAERIWELKTHGLEDLYRCHPEWEMQEGGHEMVVVFQEYQSHKAFGTLRVFRVNLRTGMETLELSTPIARHTSSITYDPVLRGSYVVVQTHHRGMQSLDFLVVNWRQRVFAIIHGFEGDLHTNLMPMPGYVVIVRRRPAPSILPTSTPPKYVSLELYSLASLKWTDVPSDPSLRAGGGVVNYWNSLNAAVLQPVLSREIPGNKLKNVSMHICEDPIRRDVFQLVVCTTHTKKPPNPVSHLYRWRFRTDNEQLEDVITPNGPTTHAFSAENLTYAGFALYETESSSVVRDILAKGGREKQTQARVVLDLPRGSKARFHSLSLGRNSNMVPFVEQGKLVLRSYV
ncbi:hypothetical protein HMN09_00919100 [Mycena chlorophos]|uniref:F-box domain-containing protein n=1 Tax=Mycena chlorophos TaxID=658473 RepID=A0A8H6SIP5_MYCCL|nr:hypothetical protein HMN09_00919100 [Mycena chlorophos]